MGDWCCFSEIDTASVETRIALAERLELDQSLEPSPSLATSNTKPALRRSY